jgi:tRNA-binding EMAP/Myf-like protein
MSNGMIMCAGNGDKSKIEILRPPEGSKIGERI